MLLPLYSRCCPLAIGSRLSLPLSRATTAATAGHTAATTPATALPLPLPVKRPQTWAYFVGSTRDIQRYCYGQPDLGPCRGQRKCDLQTCKRQSEVSDSSRRTSADKRGVQRGGALLNSDRSEKCVEASVWQMSVHRCEHRCLDAVRDQPSPVQQEPRPDLGHVRPRGRRDLPVVSDGETGSRWEWALQLPGRRREDL